MTGYYDPPLVALSVAVAVLASYTTLELAARVSQREGRGAGLWLCGGALSMGAGIWSMHFIGMLAFHLPVPVAYDRTLTLLSMAIAVVVSGIALYLVGGRDLNRRNLTAGATAMGAGISAMHYTGMHAMQMWPPIRYDPALFVLSILIAILTALAALLIAFRLRHQHFGVAVLAKLGSAVVMGLAIAGMHFTGMAAAEFAPGSVCLALDGASRMDGPALALLVGVLGVGILLTTLGIAALDAHFSMHSARLARSLATANEELRNLAHYDHLTGLPNRTLLEDRMSQAAARAARARSSMALLFIDLDHFKPINDRFGHAVGDEVLQVVARRLCACVRGADTVARTGGDEFVMVLGDIACDEDAGLVGRKVLDELSRPFFNAGQEFGLSCSIGIALYPQHGRDLVSLKANADAAMYRAKQDGRNAYRYYDAELDAIAARTGH